MLHRPETISRCVREVDESARFFSWTAIAITTCPPRGTRLHCRRRWRRWLRINATSAAGPPTSGTANWFAAAAGIPGIAATR